MGELEKKNRKVVRKTKIQEAIFLTIASGGRIGSELLVGRVIEALTGIDYPVSKRGKRIIQSAATRLRNKGLLEFENGQYSMTKGGTKIFKDWEMSNYTIKRPRKWDGKWRVMVFDIPEKKRTARTRVREILTAAGFQRLQDSVWVFPYDCEDVIGLMKTDLGVGKHLLYMIVDQIENDRFLRMDFDLI